MLPWIVAASIGVGVGRALARGERAAPSALERAGDLPAFSLTARRSVVADVTARRQAIGADALAAYRQRLRTSSLALLAEEDGATFYHVTPHDGDASALVYVDTMRDLGRVVLVSLSAVLEPGPLRLVAIVARGASPPCLTSREFAELGPEPTPAPTVQRTTANGSPRAEA